MMIGNSKEIGRVCTILLYINRKSPTPSNSELKKAKVRPRIRTWPAQTEFHRSTTCATTTSKQISDLIHAALQIKYSDWLLKLMCPKPLKQLTFASWARNYFSFQQGLLVTKFSIGF